MLNKNNKNDKKNTSITIPIYLTALLFACYLNANWLIITFSILLFLSFICLIFKKE